MVKNILFDLDDTLLDFHMAEKAALTKTLIHFDIEPKDEILERYSELNLSQWKLLEEGILTREEVKVRRYQLLFNELGVNTLAKETTEYYENILGIGHYFVDGAEEVLRSLLDKYCLYIASNGNTKVQLSRMKSADIIKYFADIFISQEIGFDKPSSEFFNSCFSKIKNFSKEETVIIGDSITSDIKGGKAAGIKTIWYNPGRKESDDIADHEIYNLLELIPLLERI
jgi:2-haloacid dehalogenase